MESQNIDAWQLVCSQDVIDTNENFCFLGLSKKLPPVLLQIEVCFVEQVSPKIKINNLFINIEILSEILSSNLLVTIPSRKQFSRDCGET